MLAAACGGGDGESGGGGEGQSAPAPATGGEQTTPAPVAEGDFAFEAKSAAIVHRTGGSIEVKVMGASSVTYEIDGLPAGIEMKEHSDASINLAFSSQTPAYGDHAIKVRAKSGSKMHEASVLLVVADDAGRLDESFSAKGLAAGAASLTAESMAVDPEGRVFVGGSDANGKLFVSRHGKDGALDKSFDGDGTATFSFDPVAKVYLMGVAATKDGSAIAVGAREPAMNKSDACIAKLDASGQLDAGFGTGGIACFAALPALGDLAGFMDVIAQDDGTLYAAGFAGSTTVRDPFVMKLTAKGEIDKSYGTAGIARFTIPQNNLPRKLAMDSQGRVLVSGVYLDPNLAANRPYVLRLMPDGTPDPWFGKSGLALGNVSPMGLTWVGGMAVAPNGDVFIAGQMDKHGAIFAFENQKGGPLTTFAPTGAATFAVGAGSLLGGIAWDDGKIVAAGATQAAQVNPHALRVTPDGKLDATFGDAGVATVSGINTIARVALVAPSSRTVMLYVNGSSYVVARAWR